MKERRSLSVFVVLLSMFCLTTPAFSATLSLNEYLEQVKKGNEGVQALMQSSQAIMSRKEEGRLLVRPMFFTNLTFYNDAKPTAVPSFMGNRTLVDTYQFGFMQQTPFGLSGKLYYQWTYTQIEGTVPGVLPLTKFYEARPVLEVNQSLWKNGFGSETQTTLELAESGTLAQAYSDQFKLKAALAEAEGVFWKLAITRQMIQVQKESLERAERLRDWSRKRARSGLGDKSDELQAEANLQVRTLEYQSTVHGLRSASLDFNSQRGVKEEEVTEKLPVLDKASTEKLSIPEKKSMRLDVRAAQAATKVAEANARLGKEKNSPTLDVFGQAATNGRTDVFGTSFSDSWTAQFPTFTVGLKFQTSLDWWQVSENRSAYQAEIKAAELNYRRKAFEEERDYRELVKKLAEAKARLNLCFGIEEVQEKKLNREKERLKLGRSVTYQVIMFEQDYASAELLRLKTQGEVLGLYTQLKLYEDSTP